MTRAAYAANGIAYQKSGFSPLEHKRSNHKSQQRNCDLNATLNARLQLYSEPLISHSHYPTARAQRGTGSMSEAAMTTAHMQAQQIPTAIMAQNMSQAAGVASIATPVSMNLLHLIVLDHNCVRAMYDAYKSPAVTLDAKQLLAWNIIMALSSHAAKEEMVVYPVVRSTLGAAVADQMLGEHSQVKTMLATLDTMAANDPSFDMQLRGSMDAMIAHMQEEESGLLPQLAAVLNAETQLQLGIQFEAAKVRAPTRPHPEAANLPPFNETSFAAAKQVDVALDQARMPSLVPTAVGLSPLVTAAMQGTAAGVAAAAAGPPPPAAPPASAPFDATAAAAAGVVQGTPVHTVTGAPADTNGTRGTAETAAGGSAAAGGDDGMDVGMDDGGDVQEEGLDALGAAGGMPGDLTGVGGGDVNDTAGGGFAAVAESGDVKFRPVPAGIAELAPSGAPDEPLRLPGEGLGSA
eukprot:GHRQ01000689.1.p1 GENE.GHRQ01000689.1~~GHRQ01000689.1.p1  ORF type:complete len:463 (+),score=169.29 GHRQ01000689.1:54-1442(+)